MAANCMANLAVLWFLVVTGTISMYLAVSWQATKRDYQRYVQLVDLLFAVCQFLMIHDLYAAGKYS